MEQKTPKKFYRRINFWLGLLISTACIVWVLKDIDFVKLKEYFKSARPEYVVIAFLISSFSYFIRAFRWDFFFDKKPMPLFLAYKCLIVGFFMNNTLPARMGELVRARAGSLATGQSITSVLATIASERLLDGVTISLYFAVLFGYFAKPEDLAGNGGIYNVVYFFAAVAICTIITLIFRNSIYGVLERVNSKLHLKFLSFVLLRIKAFIAGLEPLFMWKRIFPASVLSLAIWGIEIVVYYFVMSAFGLNLGIAGLVLAVTVVNFSSLIPAAPGGIGVIEAAATLALVSIGVDPTAALAMIATQHVIQMLVVGIPGGCFFFSVMKKKT